MYGGAWGFMFCVYVRKGKKKNIITNSSIDMGAEYPEKRLLFAMNSIRSIKVIGVSFNYSISHSIITAKYLERWLTNFNGFNYYYSRTLNISACVGVFWNAFNLSLCTQYSILTSLNEKK